MALNHGESRWGSLARPSSHETRRLQCPASILFIIPGVVRTVDGPLCATFSTDDVFAVWQRKRTNARWYTINQEQLVIYTNCTVDFLLWTQSLSAAIHSDDPLGCFSLCAYIHHAISYIFLYFCVFLAVYISRFFLPAWANYGHWKKCRAARPRASSPAVGRCFCGSIGFTP